MFVETCYYPLYLRKNIVLKLYTNWSANHLTIAV